MTKATTEGRQLVLTVEGIDAPFRVDPLSAKRGRQLTELFVEASLSKLTPAGGEAIFIEAIGAQNYARLAGMLVDEYDADGAYVRTFSPDDSVVIEELLETTSDPDRDAPDHGYVRFSARDDAEVDGEIIRQEEAESLTLCAFYWQTVVGMEAVTAFLEGGEGSQGSSKALALLQLRLGLSPSRTSRSSVLENQIQQQGVSPDTTTRNGGVTSVRLPADKRSPLGLRMPSKGRKNRR